MIFGALDGLRATSLAAIRILLDDLFDLHAANPGTFSNTFTTGPATSSVNRYGGMVLAPSGRVVFVPLSGSTIDYWDPGAGAITVGPAHGFGANTSYRWWCLLPNGKILMIPAAQATWIIFDPVTLAVTQTPAHGITQVGTAPIFGPCTLGADDGVYAAGNSDNRVIRYDYLSNTFSFSTATLGFTPANLTQFGAAVLMGEDILFFPRQPGGTIRRYTPATDAIAAAGTSPVAIDLAVPIRGREILLIGAGSANLRVYSPDNLAVRTAAAHGLGGSTPISAASPLRDGRVALFPGTGTSIVLWDPATDTVAAGAATGGVTTQTNWTYAVGLLNGAYLLVGNAIQNIATWTPWTGGAGSTDRAQRILRVLRLARHFNRR